MDTAPPSPEDVLEDLILAWATAAFQTTFPSGVGRRASGETDPCVIHTHLVYALNYACGPGVLLLDRTEMTEYHRMIPRGHWDGHFHSVVSCRGTFIRVPVHAL